VSVNEILFKEISYYGSAKSTESYVKYSISSYFNLVKYGISSDVLTYRDYVLKHGKDSAKEFKTSELGCVTPSGLFKGRNDAGLNGDFTGVIVLDLDAKDNVGIDIDEAIKDSQLIPSTLAYHKSVSGEGYALYVYVDKWTKNTYSFAMSYYTVMLGVTFDKATSNLSRLRYISYDPDIWIADDIVALEIPKVAEKRKQKPIPIDSNRFAKSEDYIIQLIDVVIGNGDDPTSDYADWFTLGCAFANGYGESGRQLFHKVSSNYHAYSHSEVDSKYDSILNMGGWKATKGSIVYILSKYQ
jgi:hypothetical protein